MLETPENPGRTEQQASRRIELIAVALASKSSERIAGRGCVTALNPARTFAVSLSV